MKHSNVHEFLAHVAARNPGQPEYLQAVTEVMESLWPFISACAVAILFVTSIFSPWAIVFGAIPAAIATAAWFWPSEVKRHPEPVIG